MDLAARLSAGEYGVLDIGCSSGGSLEFAERKFKLAAAGIDIDAAKIEKARAAGRNVWLHNLFETPLPAQSVSYAMLFHVLEHLDTFDSIARLVRLAAGCSRDAVLIRTPNFDLDGLLARRGLKFYFADWSGHKFHVTSLDYVRIINQIAGGGRMTAARIYGSQRRHGPFTDLIPLEAPVNTQRTGTQAYPPVDVDQLPFPVYSETTVILCFGETGLARLPELERALGVTPEDCHFERIWPLAAAAA